MSYSARLVYLGELESLNRNVHYSPIYFSADVKKPESLDSGFYNVKRCAEMRSAHSVESHMQMLDYQRSGLGMGYWLFTISADVKKPDIVRFGLSTI